MNMKDLYDKEIKRKDKLGYAETFKQCTETLFEEIRNYFDVDSIDIHIEDVEYLDGYFIFGSGTNSVIHFHVKECPGWKFGIWWNLPEKMLVNLPHRIEGAIATLESRIKNS